MDQSAQANNCDPAANIAEMPQIITETQQKSKVEFDYTFQHLKDLQSTFKSQVNLKREPLSELRKIIDIIELVAHNQKDIQVDFPEIYTYFLEQFLGGVVQTLTTKCDTSFKNNEYLIQIKRLPVLLASIIAANIDNAELVDSTKNLFDYKVKLYQHHCLEKVNKILLSDDDSTLISDLSPDEKAWRDQLDVGSEIDALKVDPENQNLKCWSRGKVFKVLDKNKVYIEFENDVKKTAREIHRYSRDIQKVGTNSEQEHSWRQALKPGMCIDAWDTTYRWFACTIQKIERRDFQNVTIDMLFLAYRVYHPDGDQTDKKGQRYFGYSEELYFDDWVPLYSAQLAPFQTRSDPGFKDQTKEAQDSVIEINIEEDLDYWKTHEDGQLIYAVHRKQCKSDLMIEFINAFGNLGGFDKILHKVKAQDQSSIALFLNAAYVECVARSALAFHRQFVDAYFEDFIQAVKIALLESNSKQLRATKKDKFDMVLELVYQHMMPRIKGRTAHDINLDKQLLSLELGSHFLRQSFLDKRIEGLKILSEVAKNCLVILRSKTKSHNYENQLQMVREVASKMAATTFLQEVFSKEKTHAQLVSRSETVLRVLMAQEQLSLEDLEFVWRASELGDQEIEVEVFKALIGSAPDMTPMHKQFFLEKVTRTKAEAIIDRHIELVQELCQTGEQQQNDSDFQEKGLAFLKNVALQIGEHYTQTIVTKAANAFSGALRGLNFIEQLAYLEQLAENLKSNKQSYFAIKTISELLKSSFDPPKKNAEYETLSDVILYLEQKHSLLENVVTNFKDYMENVNQIIQHEKLEASKELWERAFVDGFAHRAHITLRLGFIKFYAGTSAPVHLQASQLELMWDCMVTRSVIEDDQKAMFAWLSEVCDDQAVSSKQQVITMQQLLEFYHRKMAPDHDEQLKGDPYKLLSLTGYQCIQSFFLFINENQGKLKRITPDSGLYALRDTSPSNQGTHKQKFTSFNNQTGAQYTSYSFNTSEASTQVSQIPTALGPHMPYTGPKKENETKQEGEEQEKDALQIESLVAPNEFDGLNVIWRVATESASKAVIDAAAKLLVQLHHSVSKDLKSRLAEFEDMFLAKCFTIIESQKPEINNRSQEEKDKIAVAIAALPRHASVIQQLRAMAVEERRIARSLFLIKQLMRASEKDGTHGLKPHSALRKGAQLGSIQITNNILTNSNFRARIELSMNSHSTLWDLKKKIGEEVVKTSLDDGQTWGNFPLEGETEARKPVHPSKISVYQMSNKQIKQDSNNCSTLAELKFKENENLVVKIKSYENVKREAIVENEQNPSLTSLAESMVTEIFNRFVTLGDDSCVKFTQEFKEVSSEDNIVVKFFKNFESELAGKITLHQFKQEIIQACVNGKEKTLRQDLCKIGYAPNLDRLPRDGDDDNVLQARRSKLEMPRYKVAQNQEQFDCLLSLLDYPGEVSARAQEAIDALVTNPTLYEQVLSLKQDRSPGTFKWSSIFDDSRAHKIQYSLEIIESILIQPTAQLDREQWIKNFLTLGGLLEIQDKLQKALDHSKQSLNETTKKYIGQLLNLIRIFVTAAFQKQTKIMNIKTEKTGWEEDTSEQKHPSTPKKPISQPYNVHEITQSSLFGEDTTDPDYHGPYCTCHLDGKHTNDGSIKISSAQEELQKQSEDGPLVTEATNFEFLSKLIATGGLSELVIKNIDSEKLQQSAIQVTQNFLTQQKLNSEDKQILSSALQLWSALCFSNSSTDLRFADYSDLFIQGLILFSDFQVRLCFKMIITNLISDNQSILTQLPAFFHSVVSKIQSLGKYTKDFFDLFKSVIPQLEKDDCKNLLSESVEVFLVYQSTESRSSIVSDSTLEGMLTCMAELIKKITAVKQIGDKPVEADLTEIKQLFDRKKVIDRLMNPGLFCLECITGESSSEISETTSCIRKLTRKAAYEVMTEYVKTLKPHEMNAFIENYINPLIMKVERPSKFMYQPSSQSKQDYVGITNLGCICYMISMLQQFFMVPQFRYQLFKAIDTSPIDIVEYKGDMIDDNLLRQLQILFGYLELSERHTASAKAFCFAYKEWDGTPTKTSEQKDSQEFLNIFFERIETLLRPTSQRDLLKDVFAGNQCYQMICQTCGQVVSSRLEMFYNFSLQVVGCKGIYDSLSKMIKGETIDDYPCESCKARTSVTRRALLADTPNVLIVHLQRIIYSFDTMGNDKVNSRYEFPRVLDLKPYSVKQIIKQSEEPQLQDLFDIVDDDYVYRLVGINIHKGTADSGHYYSLINTQRGNAEPLPEEDESAWRKVETGPWKEFNDSTVRIFEFEKNYEAEALGGDADQKGAKDSMTDTELYSWLESQQTGSGKSAYMLIYERKSKKCLREYDPDAPDSEPKLIKFRDVQKQTPPSWISNQILRDNKSFIIDQQIFDENLFDFCRDLLKVIGSDMVMTQHQYEYSYSSKEFPQLKTLSFGLVVVGKVMFDMLCYAEKNTQMQAIATSAGSIMTFSDSSFTLKIGQKSIVAVFLQNYLLADQGSHFMKIMFTCGDNTARKQAGRLISSAVVRCIKLLVDCEQNQLNSDTFEDLKQTIEASISLLFETLKDKECQRNWMKLEAYFEMLNLIGSCCMTAGKILLERADIIADLIDFLLGSKSPRAANEIDKRISMGGLSNPFTPLYTLISVLVRMCQTPFMSPDQRLSTHSAPTMSLESSFNQTFILSEEAWLMLTKTEFLEKVIYENKYDEVKEFSQAVTHLCYNNLPLSRKVIKRLLKAVSWSTNEAVQRHLIIIQNLLKLQDQYQVQRLEMMFGFPFLMAVVPKENPEFTQYGLPMLTETKAQEVYSLLTNLDTRNYDDSLLSLLWKYKGKMDSFTLTCLQTLGELMSQDKVILGYLAQLPNPNYSSSGYFDWVLKYVETQLAETLKLKGLNSEEKVKSLKKVQSLFETSFGQENLNKFYVIKSVDGPGKVVSQNVFDESVQLTITQIGGHVTENNEKARSEMFQNCEWKYCKDLLYLITITNLRQKSVKIKIDFSKLDADSEVDLVYPLSGVKDFVKAGMEVPIMVLRRKDPCNIDIGQKLEMSKLNLALKWKEHNKNDFTICNFWTSTSKPSLASTANPAAKEQTQIVSTSRVPEDTKDQRRDAITINDTDAIHAATESFMMSKPGSSGVKSCPACTYDNSLDANECEICMTQLN